MMKYLNYLVAFGSVILAFAFKAPSRNAFANRIFEITVPSAPFLPSSWVEVFISEEQAGINCYGRGNYCLMSIPPTDVYSSPQRPKVDIQTAATNELQDDMITTLSLATEGTILNGRRIYESQ